MSEGIVMLTPMEKLEMAIEDAKQWLADAIKAEEADGYSDALLSMERTEHEGYLLGLENAYLMTYGKEYE